MDAYTDIQIADRSARLFHALQEAAPHIPSAQALDLSNGLAQVDMDKFLASWETKKTDFPHYLPVVEAKIIGKLLDTILGNEDLYIEVRDECGTAVKRTRDRHAIERETAATGETYYIVIRKDEETGRFYREGFIWLVHGNLTDVICDYADHPRIHELVAPATALTGELE